MIFEFLQRPSSLFSVATLSRNYDEDSQHQAATLTQRPVAIIERTPLSTTRRVGVAHLGLQVSRLIRTHYGPFTVEGLGPGDTGEVQREILFQFRQTLK